MNKKPNNFIAPIVIAGITVGFLASAYKFVFAKPKKSKDVVGEAEQTLKEAEVDGTEGKLVSSE